MKRIFSIFPFYFALSIGSMAFSAECFLKGQLQHESVSQFFLGSRGCSSTACLKRIIPNSNPIVVSEGNYRIIYVPKKEEGLKNSIVLVQLHKSGLDLDRNMLSVTRDEVRFACTGNLNGKRTQHFTKVSYSKMVNYRNFDRWHRFGSPDKGEPFEEFLRKLHVRFDNGAQCVATSGDKRRVRFLFEGRNDVPGILRKIAKGLFGEVDKAEATGIQPARTLVIKNYRVKSGGEPCVSFNFSHEQSRTTKVAFDDLENTKVVAPKFFNGTLQRFTFVSSQ